jgi:hypothetical protein
MIVQQGVPGNPEATVFGVEAVVDVVDPPAAVRLKERQAPSIQAASSK